LLLSRNIVQYDTPLPFQLERRLFQCSRHLPCVIGGTGTAVTFVSEQPDADRFAAAIFPPVRDNDWLLNSVPMIAVMVVRFDIG
jgi:hypothetical protein